MQELRDNATEGVPIPDCEPEAARVSVDAVPAASKSEASKNTPPEDVKASKRRVGVHASVLAIGFCLGWKLPDVFDVSPDTQNARVDLANSTAGSEQETTSALLARMNAEQQSRMAAEASRAQLIAELASQTLALEKSERTAAELNAQLAAERAARANAEAMIDKSIEVAPAAPPVSPAATAEPVQQPVAPAEPAPVMVPTTGIEQAARPEASASNAPQMAFSALSEGQKHFAKGELGAARRAFERAVELGLPEGALALGTTFDPVSLAKAGIKHAGEPVEARRWYRRAHAMAGGRQQP